MSRTWLTSAAVERTIDAPPYLYWRTAGVIGTISALLREGAALAIERGDERLSESLLDEITVDADAEGQAARRKRPNQSTRAATPCRQPA